MEETLLLYGPAILVFALAFFLRRQAKKKAVKSKGEKMSAREILERFWEEDR